MSTTIEELMAAKTATAKDGTPEMDTPALGADIQRHIGNLLKVSFQDMLTEPVPDRFSKLLEDLERAETAKPDENEGS